MVDNLVDVGYVLSSRGAALCGLWHALRAHCAGWGLGVLLLARSRHGPRATPHAVTRVSDAPRARGAPGGAGGRPLTFSFLYLAYPHTA